MQDLKGKKLLVLGGTRISCEIIEAAQRMGITVLVTDYNEPENSPGKQIVDQSFMVSATDVDGVVELIRQEKIDGVMVGYADILLPYYADICKKAGLPCYADHEQFELFTNKNKYKPLLRKYHIPTVEEYSVTPEGELKEPDMVRFPLLVKPADSSGARGITICKDRDQLPQAIETARAFSHTGEVLVERYIDDREVTVFWMFRDGKIHLAGIGNRHVKKNQDQVIPLPVGYTYPASVLPYFRSDQERVFKEMFRDTGIRNGWMFMQCKVENNVCIVYDIGFRLTGSLEYKHMKALCGVDPMECLIHFALTGSMGEDDIEEKLCPEHKGYAYNVSSLARPGKIAEISGIDEVRSFPGVLDVVLAHVPGEEIPKSTKGHLSQITVRTMGITQNRADLFPMMKKIENTIQIISDDGALLNLPGIEEQDIEDTVL